MIDIKSLKKIDMFNNIIIFNVNLLFLIFDIQIENVISIFSFIYIYIYIYKVMDILHRCNNTSEILAI